MLTTNNADSEGTSIQFDVCILAKSSLPHHSRSKLEESNFLLHIPRISCVQNINADEVESLSSSRPSEKSENMEHAAAYN